MARRLVNLCLIFPLIAISAPQFPRFATSIFWINDLVQYPIFIYQNDLKVIRSFALTSDYFSPPGRLHCRVNSRIASFNWYYPNGTRVNTNGYIHQVKRWQNGVRVNILARQHDNDEGPSGIWICRRLHHQRAPYVGIYREGEGRIKIDGLFIQGSFLANPPSFTLFGNTSGGVPTTFSWTLNGARIRSSGTTQVSQFSELNYFPARHLNPTRDSTFFTKVSMVGSHPGLFRYSVSNRATRPAVVRSISITVGPAPTGLRVRQISWHEVAISWNQPSRLTVRYRIDTGFSIVETTNTSYIYHGRYMLGLSYTVRLSGLYRNQFPSVPVSANFTIKGLDAPSLRVLSVTLTSITVSSTMNTALSIEPEEHTVTLIRQGRCPIFPRFKTVTVSSTTRITFTDLHEFTPYTITATAIWNALSFRNVSSTAVTTLETTPTAAPQNLRQHPVSWSRSISVTWDEINCFERRGDIIGYSIEFGPSGGATELVLQDASLSFTEDKLTPYTNYTIRVAGNSNVGTGVFTNAFNLTTDEDTPGAVSRFMAQPKLFSILEITWDSPLEPNGVIISYEVTYTLGDNRSLTVNTTALSTAFTISSLIPGSRVTATVSAYTSAGKGVPSTDDITISHIPVIENVDVEALGNTSLVVVSWDRLLTEGIAGYIVYYSPTTGTDAEKSINVSSSEDSVVISNLQSDTEYSFEVAATVEVDEVFHYGERSTSIKYCMEMNDTVDGADCSRGILLSVVISVLSSSLLTIMLHIHLYPTGGLPHHVQIITEPNSISKRRAGDTYFPQNGNEIDFGEKQLNLERLIRIDI